MGEHGKGPSLARYTGIQELRKIGDKYAKFRNFTVEGLPQ
jgi:hypothetical protein